MSHLIWNALHRFYRVYFWLCALPKRESFPPHSNMARTQYRIANEINHAFGCVYADSGVGFAYLRKGDVGAAMHVLERGLERCRVADIPVQFPLVASPLGLAYVLSGRIAEGVSLLEQAVGQTAPKRRSGQAFRVACLSEAYFHAARIEEALSQAKLALDFSRRYISRTRTWRHGSCGCSGRFTRTVMFQKAIRLEDYFDRR